VTRVLALVVLLVAAPVLWAADAPGLQYTPPEAPAAPNPAALVLRLVGLTAALLGLCAVVLWLARRANRHPTAKDAAGRMQHEGTLALDRRCAVHLIRVDGQAVAVTTDATGLRSVVVLTEPFESALTAADTPPAKDTA
jgi:uncharacterized iron-regulated membrane protein